MPFDGSGTYAPPSAPTFPAVSGSVISSTYYNSVISDIATALNNTLTRDGQGKPSAAINWNGQNLTNVAVFGATGAATFGSTVGVTGTLTAAGAVSVGTNLTVAGNATISGTLSISGGGTIWTSNNDGPGSGLDADLLDGFHAASFGRLAVANTWTDQQTFASNVTFFGASTPSSGNGANIRLRDDTGTNRWLVGILGSAAETGFSVFNIATGIEWLRITNAGAITTNGATIWNSSNDGSGSGLDADLLDGIQASAFGQLAGSNSWTNENNFAGSFRVNGSSSFSSGEGVEVQYAAATGYINSYNRSTAAWKDLVIRGLNVNIIPNGGQASIDSAVIWNAGNDGAGSGLDADTVDGIQALDLRRIPRSTTSGTATTADIGKAIAVSAGLTIPNATFAAGDALSIYNDSAASVTITQGASLTLRLAGTTTTGNRTLAARGFATVWFNGASEAIISGSGLS